MKTQILGMLAETPVHPGTGRSTGFVDLPVAREAATDYPVIVATSLKGALRQVARDHATWSDERVESVFGKPDCAGRLVVSDARLLLLPVRSLNSQYKWLTCPHLLERLGRDLRRAGEEPDRQETIDLEKGQALAETEGGKLFLEERQFEVKKEPLPDDLIERLKKLLPPGPTRQRMRKQTAVLHDDDFHWFAEYGLSVNARNKLEPETKTVETGLWYEETLPADSLFYCLLAERSAGGKGALKEAEELLDSDAPYLQVGGNETVGQGWFATQWLAEVK